MPVVNLTEVNNMNYKEQTERDIMKRTNKASVQKFLRIADMAAHGLQMNGERFVTRSAPISLSSMAVEAHSIVARCR